jgi:hypothetical protein
MIKCGAKMPLRSFADVPTLTDARGAERGDFHRSPPFSGEVTHEAMIGKVVF